MGKFFWRMAGFMLFLSGAQAWAEPYLAAWKGVNCNACHVNQTGGWLRNDFGKNYGNSLETFDWQGLSDAAQTVKHNTPSWVAVGVDMHEGYEANFFQKGPSSLNNFTTPPISRQAFEMAVKANEAVSGVFTYEVGEPGNPLKEAYGMVSNLPEGAYLKFGQFVTPPYGLTLADDNSLIRSPLGFSFDSTFVSSTLSGAEAGIYPTPLFLNTGFYNSPTTFAERIVSAKGGLQLPEITLAGSFYGQDLDLGTQIVRYGAYGWGRLGPVVLLGEYDLGYNGPSPGDNYRAYHGSAEFDLGSSVYLRLTSEWLKDSLASVYNGYRSVVSVRCYPVRNLKFQLDLQRYDPSAGTASYNANGPSFYGLLADAFIFY